MSYDIDNSKVLFHFFIQSWYFENIISIYHSELVTRKFYDFYFYELVTLKFYFNLLFRVSNSKIFIGIFNSS